MVMAQGKGDEPRVYPFQCELCHTQIESSDDAMW